jgi:DNA-binding MarR family transcriptional regulator/GNAT superfamily N-acetyltransferase
MSAVDEVRAFNRFYTRLIGALDYEGHLDSPYNLAQARVLYELAHRPGVEAAGLRRELDLDAGYFSRLLADAERDGLLTRRPDPGDARRRLLELTDAGRSAAALLDARSTRAIRGLLGQLPESAQPRLLAALRTARELLDGAAAEPGELVLRPPLPGELGWVVQRNAVLYHAEYGWDESYEALVAGIVADYAAHRDPKREAGWIAELCGEPVGAVFCMRHREEPETAQLRLLLVEPHARGHGVGGRLVAECVRFARSAGYRDMALWTNDVLGAARRIYQRAGFRLVSSEPHHSFGHDLVGQYWRLTL